MLIHHLLPLFFHLLSLKPETHASLSLQSNIFLCFSCQFHASKPWIISWPSIFHHLNTIFHSKLINAYLFNIEKKNNNVAHKSQIVSYSIFCSHHKKHKSQDYILTLSLTRKWKRTRGWRVQVTWMAQDDNNSLMDPTSCLLWARWWLQLLGNWVSSQDHSKQFIKQQINKKIKWRIFQSHNTRFMWKTPNPEKNHSRCREATREKYSLCGKLLQSLSK